MGKILEKNKRKDKVKQNTQTEILQDLIFRKGTECQILSKVLDISSAKVCIFPDLLKDLVIISDTT